MVFLVNLACIWYACGWEMETEDELLREEGAAEPAAEESLLQEAPVRELPALHCRVLREGQAWSPSCLWPKEGVEGWWRHLLITGDVSSILICPVSILIALELPVVVSSLSL